MVKKKDKPPPDRNFDYMKTNKDRLTNVVKSKEIMESLAPYFEDITNRTNKIVIHAYQFIKLFCSWKYKTHYTMPLIDTQFVKDVFSVVSVKTERQGRIRSSEDIEELRLFYEEHYKALTFEEVSNSKLARILAYEAIDMVTNIENNIKMHFVKHLTKLVNITFKVKERKAEITKTTLDKQLRKQKHKEIYDEIKLVIKDLMTLSDYVSDVKYHSWITENKEYMNFTSFEKNNLSYDIQANPQNYLYAMFYISHMLEAMNRDIRKNNKHLDEDKKFKEIRLFNVLPLRTNIVTKNVCIDTVAFNEIFIPDESTDKFRKTMSEGSNTVDLWKRFFNFNKPVFKKNGYKFNDMIRTDGVSICVLFKKVDTTGKPVSKAFSDCCIDNNTDYIERINLETLNGKRIVCADPGKSDLIYCGAVDNKDPNKLVTFRYTQAQRKHEIKSTKHMKIIDSMSKTHIITDGKTVKELETEISKLNSKKRHFNTFKKYILRKNQLNHLLSSYYQEKKFRVFKLNRFSNTQRSESKMIKSFAKKFGPPVNTAFVIGDYDKGSYNMRGCEPAICKKFRRIFKNAGYQTLLINEFRTSKQCNSCHDKLEKFHKKINKNTGKEYLCHGLLRCQSVKHKREIIHNRDKNAVQNMLKITQSLFDTGQRPEIFTRTESIIKNL